MSELQEIQAGTLVAFSEGEYSDYNYLGHFVALSTITNDDYQKAAREELVKGAYEQNHFKVIANLIRAGKLLEVTCSEVFLGAYGIVRPQMEIL